MREIKVIIGESTYDKYPYFLRKLNRLYEGRFLKQNPYNPESYRVRWFMQEATFSYEIFKHKNAFLGTPEYQSEVFWNGNDEIDKIIKDIYDNVKKLRINENKQV